MALRFGNIASLSDKVAIVTGGSSGLGRAIAQAYAAAGAYVISADLQPKPPLSPIIERKQQGVDLRTPTVDLINSTWPSDRLGVPRATFVKCDVTSEGDWDGTVSRAVASYGRLDILANNAGIALENTDRFKPGSKLVRMHEMSPSILDRVMAVNVRGAWLGMKYAAKQFLDQDASANGDRGWIINTSSILGQVGSPGASCYCASKGALIQLTKAAALEYAADGIHVNAVQPGFTESSMLERLYHDGGEVEEQLDKVITDLHPWGRAGRPEDIARVFVFLAGEGASWMTGVSVPVDGGYLA